MNATKTTHGIETIDGLFVPYTAAGDDGAGQGFEPGLITYWGVGYPTYEEARACLDSFEAGVGLPPGVRVDMDNGRRFV